ncbi:organic cation transporter protein isoform X3 [Bombyx mori]|uniref:Major facilitator superfamily (MFS) profile domain-containing protein n=1 Tax=Bombyx mori TaxID=7091 RepID=A0A8R2G863_BOMMO|nr:organic cation transporter protein isoform X3 [Bombyx mori]
MVVKENIDLEHVLSKFSLKRMFYVKFLSLLLFSGVTNSFYNVNYVFAAADVRYRCKYPECDNKNSEVLNFTFDNGKCTKYALLNKAEYCSVENIDLSRGTSCKEWVYEEKGSFVEELGTACEDWKRTLVGTVHSFGYMIGLLIVGPLADKLGRKKLIIFSGITAATMGLGRSITSSYWVYVVLELIEALFGDTYSATFMLGVEMVTKENRVIFITLMTASTALAGIVMALIAWALPYWRHFLRAIYGPSLFFIMYIFLLDESVRWLLIKGQKEKGKEILKKAAEESRVELNADNISIKCEDGSTKTDMVTLLKITFRSNKLVLRFLACVCMWITGIFNKYTLLINSVELEGNKYVNFGLTTFSELPASFVLGFVLKKYKRKMPLIFSFILTGIFCVGQSFVPKGNAWLSLALFLIGKFMATISYATVYLYTSELFPTYTRNTMHALCSSLGRIASILAPQTPLLIHHWPGFPSVIVGGLSLVTGTVVIFMPETSEDVLPDTVREAEAIGTKFGPDTCTRL